MAELMRACLPEKRRDDHGALFPCDDDPTIQIAAIYKALGSLPPALVDRLQASSRHAELTGAPYPTQPVRDLIADLIKESTIKPRQCRLESLFPYIQEDAVDLLKLMLSFDPMERPTAAQLMRHHFFHYVSRKLQGVQIPPVEVSMVDIESLELVEMPNMVLKAKLHDMVYPDLIWRIPPELREEAGGTQAAPDDSTQAAPDDSTQAAPDDSTQAAPDNSTQAAPDDSTQAAPDDSTQAAPDDSTQAAPDDSTQAAPDDSTQAAPDD
jgi:serine/threonine protein kinase